MKTVVNPCHRSSGASSNVSFLAMGPWTGPFIARHSQLQSPVGLFTNAGVSTAAIILDKGEAPNADSSPPLARYYYFLNCYEQRLITDL